MCENLLEKSPSLVTLSRKCLAQPTGVRAHLVFHGYRGRPRDCLRFFLLLYTSAIRPSMCENSPFWLNGERPCGRRGYQGSAGGWVEEVDGWGPIVILPSVVALSVLLQGSVIDKEGGSLYATPPLILPCPSLHYERTSVFHAIQWALIPRGPQL